MESSRFDVVVIGAGLSGLIAASTAARENLQVALVASGPGYFFLGSGCLESQEIVRLGATTDLNEAIGSFCEMARLAGCPFEGGIASRRLLPTILGDFKNVALAPRLLWNAEPRANASTAIVGIRGLSDFDENFMADRLRERARSMGLVCSYAARQISLPGDCGAPVTTLRIAKRFDRDPEFRSDLIDTLRRAASGFERIFVPSMLGLHSSESQILRFEREAGCALCELPTLPPSIPALRLFHHLSSYLQKIGVEMFQGFPVQKLEIHDRLCSGVHVASPGHALMLHGESVVLATGRQASALLDRKCRRLDTEMRPLDAGGSPVAWNLFAAGSRVNNVACGRGEAMEILTGYRAAKSAAAQRGSYAAR
jgi:glycerol-3-phosphate dehydrogenase subunit B